MIGNIYNSPGMLLFAIVMVGSLMLGWVFPASMMAIKPGEVSIINGYVSLYRVFPGDNLRLPRPVMSYKEVIRPLTLGYNGGHPCVQTGGPFRYVSPAPVASWSLDWAQDCISDPVGFHWEAAWVWHIGAVKLGPVRASTTFVNQSEVAQ